MDISKCNALKRELAVHDEPQIVAIDRFFDGNDDLGSIGCNLSEHPGIAAFRQIFVTLRKRPDVQSIYAQITELDPGEDSWPFTDTILVVGSIPTDDLRRALAPLGPDEVGPADPDMISKGLSEAERGSTKIAWWD